VTGTAGSVLNIPFNFGDDVPAGFPQVYLLSPIFNVTDIFDLEPANSRIRLDTDGFPAGTFQYRIWYQLVDENDYWLLTIVLT
jgi:hypothetical protein